MRRRTRGDGRALGPGMPVAIAGSIALSALATPAHAEPAASPVEAAGLAAAVPTTVDPPTYTVQSGDTVTAIAGRHGLRTTDVLSWNGLGWSTIIRPGQVLRLSAPDGAAPPAAPSPPPPPAAPAPAPAPYTIVSGDTMSGIAARHGVSTDALLAANGLSRSSIIYPGQSVAIPGAAAPASAPPAAPPAVTTPAPAAVALDAEQAANAQTVIRVGRSLGVPDLGIAIALATAMQESSLRNLDHGPDDSLGLFQQRPSMGWGTDAEVRDTERATRVFFGGPGDPNGTRTRGLLDHAGWEGVGFAQAAQAVQVSAYPDRYARWEQAAYGWLAALG